MPFKHIAVVSADIVERAKEYRKHEDGCAKCKAARYRRFPNTHRCAPGQLLWRLVFGG